MKLPIQAAFGIATWLTHLLTAFLTATNDVAWVLNAEVSRPLMAHANCLFPTMECIRQAKAAGVALAKSRDDEYWCNVREEKAKADKIKAEKQAYDDAVALAFTKADKYDVLVKEPPVYTILQNNYVTNYITNNNLFVSECTPPPVVPGLDLQRLEIANKRYAYGEEEKAALFNKIFPIAMELVILIPLLSCCCLLRCCYRMMKRNRNPPPNTLPTQIAAMASSQTQTDSAALPPPPTQQDEEKLPRIATACSISHSPPSEDPPSANRRILPMPRRSNIARQVAKAPTASIFSSIMEEARNIVERQPGE